MTLLLPARTLLMLASNGNMETARCCWRTAQTWTAATTGPRHRSGGVGFKGEDTIVGLLLDHGTVCGY